ncbi:MAG: hypothetical protein PHV37_08780 [Candidatus Gastranaerophilales bacterium]|nr:hypothetical protein [Candidatus Gastranaerophilales bacterium]
MRVAFNIPVITKQLNFKASFGVSNPGGIKNTLDDVIDDTIKDFSKKVKKNVPQKGRNFQIQTAEGKNPDLNSEADKFKFSFKPSTDSANETGRIMRMDVFSKEGNSYSPIFECGTKDELLAYVEDKNFVQKVKDAIKLSEQKLSGSDIR